MFAPVKLCLSTLSKSKTLSREWVVLSHTSSQSNLPSVVFSKVLDLYSVASKVNLIPAILTPLPVLLLFLEIFSLSVCAVPTSCVSLIRG